MSHRHGDAFRAIRREYDDVVAALKLASQSTKRGAPGAPGYDPIRLEAAIATAGDAYCLLLIATAEAFLRDYLGGIGIAVGAEPKLSTLIDKSAKEFNCRSVGFRIRADDRSLMHDLRVSRNEYAHGHGRSVFASVPKVESVVSKFLAQFP